jgi:hypothetical protein
VAACGQRRGVEGIDLLTPVSRKRDMHRRPRPVLRGNRKVGGLLEPELDLVIAPRANLGKPKR